jgi:hypothetical protein
VARNYVVLPYEYLEEMDALSNEEFGSLCRALLKYGMDGTISELTGNERFVFKRVMMQEDRFRASYEELANTRKNAGKKGAEKRWKNHDDSKAIANDSKNSKAIANDSKNGYTETETNTETNILSPKGSRISARERKSAKKDQEPKVQWAENVTMTNAEHESLLSTHGPADTARLIELLDNYKGSSGKRYKSDYRAILSWCVERLGEEKARAAAYSGKTQGASAPSGPVSSAEVDRFWLELNGGLSG